MLEPSTPRIVLDTNVCLDLFVFEDPRVAHLRAAIDGRVVFALTDDACREEWLRVLAYPQLALDAERQAAASIAFDASMEQLAGALPTAMPLPAPLPRCRDPDDQKFLELASRVGARWLLSRDDHLLALDRRMRRDSGLRILTPQAWSAEHPAL